MIAIKSINAEININKLINYAFAEKSNGKQKIFSFLGFEKGDSELLKYEYEKQAEENFIKGNYLLKNVDKYGQRIAIPIRLNGKTILSGWMIEPEGHIRNTTPFGGWLK